MKAIVIEAMNGANKAERAGLILLMLIVALAIVSSTVMMLYWYASDIKRSTRRNAIKFAYWLEDAADRFDKWNTLREDHADFTEIADWADYKKWKQTQVPMWYQVIGAMINGNLH